MNMVIFHTYVGLPEGIADEKITMLLILLMGKFTMLKMSHGFNSKLLVIARGSPILNLFKVGFVKNIC